MPQPSQLPSPTCRRSSCLRWQPEQQRTREQEKEEAEAKLGCSTCSSSGASGRGGCGASEGKDASDEHGDTGRACIRLVCGCIPCIRCLRSMHDFFDTSYASRQFQVQYLHPGMLRCSRCLAAHEASTDCVIHEMPRDTCSCRGIRHMLVAASSGRQEIQMPGMHPPHSQEFHAWTTELLSISA